MSVVRPHRLLNVDVSPVRLDANELEKHAMAADAGPLVAALAQIRADASILDRFSPLLETSQTSKWSGVTPPRHLPEDAMSEVIRLLKEALSEVGAENRKYVHVFEGDVFRRAVEVATGELPGTEFVPVMQEQAGFVADVPIIPQEVPPSADYKVLVLGTGMSGISAAIAAADAGFEYEIYEAADDIGGTWRINTYPGVAVDTPSIYYSYSFELKKDWSLCYPLGDEYQNYLRHVVSEYGLTDHIRFNTRIDGLRWDERSQEWEVTATSAGKKISSRFKFVITATGFLTGPKFPDVPGIDSFKGLSLHSTEWSKDVDLRGKRVAVIGAGATSVQIVDAVIGEVEHLTLFQRQPHWVRGNSMPDGGRVGESELWLLENVPFYAQWQRAKAYWFMSDKMYDAVRVDPEWIRSHEMSISAENHWMMLESRKHLDESFKDNPELKAKLTPNFPIYGKRPIRDPGNYYAALASDKASVVTEPLAAIEPTGIRTADGAFAEVDVIVYATGFNLDYLSTIEIVGRGGVRLADQWETNSDPNPRAYLGGTVPNFPNLFVTSAPNTGNGHGGGHNFMTEIAVHYITECMQLVVNKGADSIEVKPEVEEKYFHAVNELFEGSVWKHRSGAHTYYTNARGRVLLPSPWRMVDFWHMHRQPAADEFIVR